jgi:transcription termination factor NusB
MAWTLADLSKIETDVLRKSVMDTLIMESNPMEMIPWETIGQLATKIVRYASLPSVGSII